MSPRPIADGEQVLLLDDADHRQLVRLEAGARYHSHLGSVRHDDLIGCFEGARATTSTGRSVRVFRPRLLDFLREMPRRTAVMSPKDIAMLLLW
ncbi:MAG: hypothetical protein IT307_05550, partial [Chloroflexi bacterium]|nr:hypothetical protein [Chloroflexota bacterium]